MDEVTVIVIGAGFSGIAAAVKLREAGITDFVMLERDSRVGGTWRDAQYPGAEVDVPSWLYSLSFAPNPDWKTMNSSAAEILSYIDAIVDQFGLAPHLRFGADVIRAEFDADSGTWRVSTKDGRLFTARALIAADGLLANSEFPDIPGMQRFTGQKMLSAAWVKDYDFTGKRVGVVGTGASAVQIVPELVKTAGHVAVFQRSSTWMIPRHNFTIPATVKKVFRRFPAVQRTVRTVLFCFYEILAFGLVKITPLTKVIETVSKVHLRTQVKDRELRKLLAPGNRVGCKRPLITSAFYPALQKDNAQLVPYAVTEITPSGVVAADGSEHELDCLVFATGYDVKGRGGAFTVVGLEGRVLAEDWAHGMVGYKSVNVAGYPNLFWTVGPNSFSHTSELLFVEEQVNYAVQGIKQILDQDLRILDVLPQAQDTHNEKLQRKLAKTTFNSGCQSWYLSDGGFNGTMFPGGVTAYRRQMARLQLSDYLAIPVASASEQSSVVVARQTVPESLAG